MTYLPAGLPIPEPMRDGLDATFWEGLRDHRLVVQRCAACGVRWFPPEWLCPKCRSLDFAWDEMGATGRIFTWTRVWHPTHPALTDTCPYVAVVVELDDDRRIRLVGNLVADPLAEVVIGAPVEAVFEDAENVTLVQWRTKDPKI